MKAAVQKQPLSGTELLSPERVHSGPRVLTFVLHADEQRAGQTSEHETVQLAVVTDCGHVDNWQQLLNVVGQNIVEEALISLLHMRQKVTKQNLL